MKFCMIGWCGHSFYIIDGLKKLPDFELVGIASGEEDRNGQYIWDRCKDSGIPGSPKLYDNWITMLDELKPDVISADGPYHLHGIECLEAAKRGIHEFSEKPISLKLDELDAIEKTCSERRGCSDSG